MARRTGLPEHIRKELPDRARAGVGLDPDAPTLVNGVKVSADFARQRVPSEEMLGLVGQVEGFLATQGAKHIDVVRDFRKNGCPGDLTVRWYGPVAASVVAGQFAVSVCADGTPRIPAWLSLRADDDFDLRWQPAF